MGTVDGGRRQFVQENSGEDGSGWRRQKAVCAREQRRGSGYSQQASYMIDYERSEIPNSDGAKKLGLLSTLASLLSACSYRKYF